MSKPNNSKPQLWKVYYVYKKYKIDRYRIIYPNGYCEYDFVSEYDEEGYNYWCASCFAYGNEINTRKKLMDYMRQHDAKNQLVAVFARNL